jgi:hypothetical protein
MRGYTMSNYLQPLTTAEIEERQARYERKIARLKKEHRIDLAFFMFPIVFLVAVSLFF